MCEYCKEKGNRKKKYIINEKTISLRIENDNELEILSFEENSRNIKHTNISINYCPICGRKLGRDNK